MSSGSQMVGDVLWSLAIRAEMRPMPALHNRTIRLCVLTSSMAVALALAGTLGNAVADDEPEDGTTTTQVTKPPDDGFWYKIIVHHCLPQTAVTMHYVIDRDSHASYKDEREKFERTKNSYQSSWIPMEKGAFWLERVEFLDDEGKVVLAVPHSKKESMLPLRFELTEGVPAGAVALPAQKEHGQCKIVR